MRFTKRWAEHHRDVLPRRALFRGAGVGPGRCPAPRAAAGPRPTTPQSWPQSTGEAALTSPPGAERKMGDDSGSGSEDGGERERAGPHRDRAREGEAEAGQVPSQKYCPAPRPTRPREPPPARACVHLMARRGAVLDRQAAAAVLRAPLPRQGRHLHRPAPGQGRGGPPAPSLRRAVCPGALNQAPRRVRVWQMGVCGGLAVICGCVN